MWHQPRTNHVGETHEVRGDSWTESELTAPSGRFLQVAARVVELPGAMLGDPEMPQGVRQGTRIVCLGREGAGPLECRNRGGIIVPYDLVTRADPELGLSLTPDVNEAAVQLECPLEQDQLGSACGTLRAHED